MHYMLLLYVSERPERGTPEAREAFERMRAFHHECRDRGVLVASSPLTAAATATSVRLRDGELLMTDGPFAETTEWLGGYFVLDCADLDEALRWAATIPAARFGCIELRPLLVMPGPG
jgi:hypothetical protein